MAEAEPEGFGDAVQAAALMLALMTAAAWIGFQWQRQHERTAQAFAEDLMMRVSHRGDGAFMPVWSGPGDGPASAPARASLRVLRGLGAFEPGSMGRCRVHSRFALCRGTRYHCDIVGSTPRGPVRARIGLCSPGGHAPYTLDTFDLTLPAGSMVTSDGRSRDHDDPMRFRSRPAMADDPAMIRSSGAGEP